MRPPGMRAAFAACRQTRRLILFLQKSFSSRADDGDDGFRPFQGNDTYRHAVVDGAYRRYVVNIYERKTAGRQTCLHAAGASVLPRECRVAPFFIDIARLYAGSKKILSWQR